jgi:hypothetical protein
MSTTTFQVVLTTPNLYIDMDRNDAIFVRKETQQVRILVIDKWDEGYRNFFVIFLQFYSKANIMH